MFPNRRSEHLDMRPAANPLLDALTARFRILEPRIVLQGPGPGPWAAYYLEDRLIALARPAASGAAGAIEIAFLTISTERTVSARAELDDPAFGDVLRAAIERGTAAGSSVGTLLDSGAGWTPLDAAIALVGAVVGIASWVGRTRREARAADTPEARAALATLNAARWEAHLRTNSLTIGCIGAIVAGCAAIFIVAAIGAWLVGVGVSPVIVTIAWLLTLLIPWLVFQRYRRRYPSAPQRPFERFVGIALKVIVGLILLGIVVSILMNRR